MERSHEVSKLLVILLYSNLAFRVRFAHISILLVITEQMRVWQQNSSVYEVEENAFDCFGIKLFIV